MQLIHRFEPYANWSLFRGGLSNCGAHPIELLSARRIKASVFFFCFLLTLMCSTCLQAQGASVTPKVNAVRSTESNPMGLSSSIPSSLLPSEAWNTQTIELDFMPSKSELSRRSQLSIKRLFSVHGLWEDPSRVQALTATVLEDGSYLENLCEERLKALEAYLSQSGLRTQVFKGKCPLAKLSSNEQAANLFSHLIVVFAPRVMPAHAKGEIRSRASPSHLKSISQHPPSIPQERDHTSALTGHELKEATLVSTDGEASQKTSVEPSLQPPLSCAPSPSMACEEEGALKDALDVAPQRIAKGTLVHLALGELARAEGWTFIWYPQFSWKAIADIPLSGYPNAMSAVSDVVDLLRLEGKPLQLRVSLGNKVMEILSTEVSHE